MANIAYLGDSSGRNMLTSSSSLYKSLLLEAEARRLLPLGEQTDTGPADVVQVVTVVTVDVLDI